MKDTSWFPKFCNMCREELSHRITKKMNYFKCEKIGCHGSSFFFDLNPEWFNQDLNIKWGRSRMHTSDWKERFNIYTGESIKEENKNG